MLNQDLWLGVMTRIEVKIKSWEIDIEYFHMSNDVYRQYRKNELWICRLNIRLQKSKKIRLKKKKQKKAKH